MSLHILIMITTFRSQLAKEIKKKKIVHLAGERQPESSISFLGKGGDRTIPKPTGFTGAEDPAGVKREVC